MFDGSFEPFSRTPEYLDVNQRCTRAWVDAIPAGCSILRILDIATGVGTVANMFIEELARRGHHPDLTCLDSSRWALELARRNIRVSPERVSFRCADVRDDVLPEGMDVVVWGNGIHYLKPDDHRTAIPRLVAALGEGGCFCFNTAFHVEATLPDTRAFYATKIKEAARILHSRGLQRIRGVERKPAAQPQPASYYLSLVEASGLRLLNVQEYLVKGSLHFWQAIGSFHDYAEGALPGYPVPAAAEALVAATTIAFNQHASEGEGGDRYVERKWLSVIAERPPRRS